MSIRWMVERNRVSHDLERLKIIEVYAEGESKETVKAENKQWSHKRSLIKIDCKGVRK